MRHQNAVSIPGVSSVSVEQVQGKATVNIAPPDHSTHPDHPAPPDLSVLTAPFPRISAAAQPALSHEPLTQRTITPADLERASIQAWPALEECTFGNLRLRCAGGFTKRANSAVLTHQPLPPNSAVNNSSGDNSAIEESDIAEVETWYATREQNTIFRLTEPLNTGLDDQLSRHGYRLADPSLVMVNDLSLDLPFVRATSHRPQVRLMQGEDWLERERLFSNRPSGDQRMMQHILACNAASNDYMAIEDNGTMVASGLGVRQRGLYAIFCIRTAQSHRRRGYATALICSMLQRAKASGATHAWLQVLESNIPAIGLYRSLCFSTSHRYWYRIRP
ncbi:MAG: GNAT family N-acetyltransferase [Halodesulfovibrio sp.]